ncbi:hypothetical protein BDP27DRAFT_1366820 [Rhodocollybia butyracea]|uniref:Uncharacterized protein n=1 Tax=Rhodocollybia butyracea TaxID=206335 RepID=A0A9P5U2R0_9AGAR|nr:hypothetical protein BDP27DRAFT_1366820 [Rhodocollybia butyracea]
MNLKGSTANSNAVDEEGVRALWFTGFDMKGDLHWQPLCPRHIWNKNPATLKSYPLDQSLQATSKCAGMIYKDVRLKQDQDATFTRAKEGYFWTSSSILLYMLIHTKGELVIVMPISLQDQFVVVTYTLQEFVARPS